MKSIILNPLFPFQIKPLSPGSVDQFLFSGVYQMIYLKEGVIQLEDKEINKGYFIYTHYHHSNIIKSVFNLKGYQILFKKKIIDLFNFNQSELRILEELSILSLGQKEKINFVQYMLSKDLSFELNIILNKMNDEFIKKDRAYHSAIKIRFLELILVLYRSIETLIPDLHRSSIDRVIDYIDANYSENLTLEELAELGSFNPSYLSRIFKEKKGQSIFEYVNIKRINKAIKLLINTKMTILEVSITVGYNNLSYFNRTFRKIMNTSPKEYRINRRR